MGRNILGVIAGYVAMFLIVFLVFTVAYLAMGAERAFKESSYDVSTLWIMVSVIVGFFAALVGGAVCALVSKRSMGATLSLMVLVLVLGAVSALMAMGKEAPEGDAAVRGPETSNTEAMMNAQQPAWILIANPIIGVFGVMTGAMMLGGWSPKKRDQE
jgi:hypothetical protein